MKIDRILMEQIWKLYFWKDRGSLPTDILNFLKKSQYWDRDKIEKYQTDQLNRLLHVAYEGSPFYTEHYNNHIIKLNNVNEISALPNITKDIIKNNLERMLVKNIKCRSFEHITSGSTGDPLTVQISTEAQVFRSAGVYRFYDWWDIRPYDRNILIWGRKGTQQQESSVDILKKIKTTIRKNTVGRTFFINVFNLSSALIKEYYDKAVAFKPVYLRGYMSGVVQYAGLLSEAGLDASRLNLRLVVVTAEILFDYQRSYLEKVFACPVANEYGSADAGLFAFDCPHNKMHIFEEAVLLSPLADGRLSVTEYHNTKMPLINYINNDSISISDEACDCGRTLRVINNIHGRIMDYVVASNGQKIVSAFFQYLIKELDDIGLKNCVKKFKVIQRGLIIEFFIVKDKGFSNEVVRYLSKRIKTVLGNEIHIQFHIVDEIEREKSGKLRNFIQETV